MGHKVAATFWITNPKQNSQVFAEQAAQVGSYVHGDKALDVVRTLWDDAA